MNAAARRIVRARAGCRCEYCGIHEDDEPYAFHVEHIISKKHGGSDVLYNLAWSCQSCNLAKSSNLSGWLHGEVITLFHPRRQDWKRHFRWRGPVLIGRSKSGRATVRVLNINADDRIDLRKLLLKLGVTLSP